MSNLVVKENTAVQVQQESQGSEVILKNDILLPRLLLMQGLSEFVAERKKDPNTNVAIAQGDMVKSLTCEVSGGPDKAVEIIPLTYINQWVLKELVGGKYEYRKTNVRDHGIGDDQKDILEQTGENLSWEFDLNGAKWRRVKSIGLYALLVSDIEAFTKEVELAVASGEVPDFNKAVMPVLINFRSTSFNAGKKVVTHFALASQMASYGAIAHGYTLKLTCHQEKNDQGSFYVFDIEKGRKCTPAEMMESRRWYSKVTTESIKVDERDDEAQPGAKFVNSDSIPTVC